MPTSTGDMVMPQGLPAQVSALQTNGTLCACPHMAQICFELSQSSAKYTETATKRWVWLG